MVFFMRRIIKNESGTYVRVVNSVLQREGLPTKNRPLSLTKLHTASIFLFRHILHAEDPRWRIAVKYAELKENRDFKPINLENALLATYASRVAGRRGKFSVYGTLEELTQLSRALMNFELGTRYIKALGIRQSLKQAEGYSVQFEKTKSISRGADKSGVTGCPEALWQLQLYKGQTYLGRIGFNFHVQSGPVIVTIANVQGARNRLEQLEEFREKSGSRFGEFLCLQLKEALGDGFIFSGVKGRRANKVIYTMSFRKSRVPVFSKNDLNREMNY